jgi:hypothetical protein
MNQDLTPNFKQDLTPYLNRYGRACPGFYTVVNDLHVFKKISSYRDYYDHTIANLIIPAGEVIFIGIAPGGNPRRSFYVGPDYSGKMRATKAFVHSIVTYTHKSFYVEPIRLNDIRDIKQVKSGRSKHISNFIYRVGKTVTPHDPSFSFRPYECDAGIHFFLTLKEALNYN